MAMLAFRDLTCGWSAPTPVVFFEKADRHKNHHTGNGAGGDKYAPNMGFLKEYPPGVVFIAPDTTNHGGADRYR